MRKTWTATENDLIRKHYPDRLTKLILSFFEGRTVGQIQSHAHVLGVKKSKAFYASAESGRISKNNDIGGSTRFKKGEISWNKGKKQVDYMSAESIAKSAKTRFKKGQDPHNTHEIGYERISKDGYVEVKFMHLKNGKGNNENFEFKHRIIYKEKIGEIPEGMIVEFLDGDKTNFDVSNLVLRTRKENLLRNTMCDSSIVKRFLGVREPELVKKIINEIPAVVELKRNQIKLNQKIRKNELRNN